MLALAAAGVPLGAAPSARANAVVAPWYPGAALEDIPCWNGGERKGVGVAGGCARQLVRACDSRLGGGILRHLEIRIGLIVEGVQFLAGSVGRARRLGGAAIR